MKGTPLKRYTLLKAHKRLNTVSPRRLQELRDEVPVRVLLCQRCGGRPIHREYPVIVGNKREIIKTVVCLGGTCEICKKPAGYYQALEPHENPPRARGGKVSLRGSLMACQTCHKENHGEKVVDSQPMWSRKG